MPKARSSPLAVLLTAHLLSVSALAGCDAQRDLRSQASDSIRIEEIDIDFPSWRLIFDGQVRDAVRPEELTAADIESLDLMLLPRVQPPDEAAPRARQTDLSPVSAIAMRDGRVIGEQRGAYELVTIVNAHLSIEDPALLGSIEPLPELPDAFVLVDAGGEELFRIEREARPLPLEIERAELRRGGVRLAWAGSGPGDDPRYQVFLSTDRFRTYERVHPAFSGEGEQRAMRRTSYTLDLSRHHVDSPELFLLVLANDRLRVAWRAFRVTLDRLPEYEYRIRILQPAEGATIGHHWFFRLNASMDVRVETPGERYNGRPYRFEPVDATLAWSSDRDGPLASYRTRGHGFEVDCPAHGLSPGVHHLTVTGRTPTGATATSSVRVEIVAEPGAAGGGPTECRVPEAYRVD